MTDQYKDQYKKETEQIHAPAELIARTKIAMREEEERIRQDRKCAKGFAGRRWVYPLTAAAALLILVSVSLTMRGLKSGSADMAGAAYEEIAAETESAEMSGGADSEGGVPEAGAGAIDFAGASSAAGAADAGSESVEEAALEDAVPESADEMLTAEATADFADSGVFSEEESRNESAQKAERKEAAVEDLQREKAYADKGSAEAEAIAETKGALPAETEEISVERVTEKPAFCGRADMETHVISEETFQVVRETDMWMAYVETGNGNQYVIRGEAEDVETFLEAGYRKLLEMQ